MNETFIMSRYWTIVQPLGYNIDMANIEFIREQTKKDKEIFDKQNFRFLTSFLPGGIYQTLQRKRDKSE